MQAVASLLLLTSAILAQDPVDDYDDELPEPSDSEDLEIVP